MHFDQKIGVRGQQNLQVLVNKEVVRETGYHKNMILNTWFNDVFNESATNLLNPSSNLYNHCVVGTGTTPPAAEQVNLTTFLAGKQYTDAPPEVTSLGVTSNILTIRVRRTWTFAESAVIGNVSETGTTNGTTAAPTSSTRLLTRALVLDTGGNPNSISVGAGEQLRVIHDTFITFSTLRTSVNYDVTTAGNTTSHLIEMEYCNIGTSFLNFLFGNDNFIKGKQFKPKFGCTSLTFNAGFGATTKTGSTTLAPTVANSVFAPDGLGCTMTFTLPSTTGNVAGGLGGMEFGLQGGGEVFAMKFTPSIPKTSLNKLVFSMTFSFARV